MKQIFILLLITFSFSQWYSMEHNGSDREYYITESVSSLQPAALIINMHGFGSNALQQAATQMVNFTNENIIVVYPQGATNSFGYTSWNVGTYWDGNNYDDVDFISQMIDNIAEDFIGARDFAYQTKYSSGDGWLLVGDAKGFIDPVYSTGVFLALKSGELAGDAICHALQVNDTSAEMLAAWIPDYDRRVNWFHRLVDLFYDCDFHFGSFFADHPDQVSTLSNLLMGRIFEMELEPHELFKKITQWKRQQQPLS